MKKPPTVPREPELLSYKLEYTPDLRCEKQTDLVPVCHRCKSCILSWRIFSTREWFTRASHITQRQFLVGIIKRFKNQDLLMYAWNLLRSVTNSKDFTYSRSCVSSSFVPSSTLDRALDPQKLEQAMASLWKWFLNAGFWTKANYTLLLLQMCDSQLVLIAASLIRILLSQKKTKKVKAAEEKAKDEELPVEDQERPSSEVLTHLTTDSTDVPSVFDNAFASEKNKLFGPLHVQRVWPTDLDEVSESSFGTEDAITSRSTAPNVTTESTTPKKTPVDINRFKDFIHCLPIHLSKRILGMLDHKSLSRCVYVSPYWAFLVKQIRKDLASRRALHNEVVFFQASCPKRAAASYARIVKVAIPQITEDGDIVPVGSRTKLQVKEFEHLQKAYHGQMTATVKLEERNIFCSSYNVRILIDKLDPNRVIHYSGGKLMAIGSADRKIHFLNVDMVKEVPPLIRGHAGSIRALYLNEQKGFILSGSFDLSIRMWSILTGTCVKIFNGHSGSITCLDLYKTKFVSGAKDCTAKMWDIETGKCLKTFRHKGIVWAAKMNDTHVVSACEKGEVKVWHVGTFILIKTLEGHLGPVKCLSFDEWHLVTGSNDGYILGWSMLGNHKRCLMAFRHPMEVLYLGFLYLRVISGCADGKIRIFNFLTGTCLRIMRANSRGDPVASICIVENRLLINAQGSVVLFQFEEVTWEYTSTSERVTHKKDHSKFDETPLRIKPDPHSHTERQKRAKKKNWKLYKTEEIQNETMLSYYITREFTRGSKAAPVLHYEMVKEPPPGTSPDMRKNVVRLDSKPSDRQRLSSLASIKGQKTDSDAESISTLKGSSDDESGYESPAPVSPLRGQIPEAFVNYIKKKQSLGPVANDQLLLTVSTIQHAYKADHVSVNMAYNMKIKDAWGPIHPHKEQYKKILAPQIPKQQKSDPSTQLKQLKAAAGTPGIERISTPYETKTLQLNLKNSLLGDSVQSFIPTPTLTRSKSCSSLSGEKKAYTTQAKIPSPPPGGKQVIGYFTSSNESIKVPRMKIAQPDTEVISRRPKLLFAHTPNPYRLNTGFRLLTTQQMKEYEEAKVSEYQAKKTEVIANRQKECKNAWLRKIKGLPIDDFTKEGKISAPELGQNVFI